MDNMKHRRLQELDRSDFEVVDGEPDIRGWDVKNSSGKKIGEVEELILDAQQKKVRYMVVDLDDNDFDLEEKKVLIPIGLAELDKEEDDVIVPNVTVEHLKSLPEYDRDHLTPEMERTICSVLGRQTQSNTSASAGASATSNQDDNRNSEDPDAEFYSHEYYSTDNLYKHRLHELDEKKREKRSASEYDQGLKLWEKRSSGGIVEGRRNEDSTLRSERESNYSEIDEEARMQMVKNRRDNYQRRRYSDGGRSEGRSKTIIDRTREEGLQDGK